MSTPLQRESDVPTGGIWQKQEDYGGKRLKDEFAAGEDFILWGLKDVGDIKLPNSDDTVQKTILFVSRIDEPTGFFEVTTISGPINELAKESDAKGTAGSDFPVVAYWEEVGTSRELNDAQVIRARGRYEPEGAPSE